MSVEGEREKEIFWKAAQIPSSEERRAYLDEACGDDARLRAAVEKLLSLHESGRQLIAVPVLAAGDALDVVPISEKAGDVIGEYKLLQKIGEGGFGVVYMALQMRPVRRHVALKIIKVGMDTRSVIARFEAEQQAMALMDHPNIAQVFDAGVTATGRPYFAMELVHGIPITEYCDQNNLDVRGRLELFTQVCSALQHAHQKGIIHRDLKPSNILVTLHGATPVPKVIDFGIAKAMDRPLTDRTLYTTFGAFMGTPQYTSPEQAALSGLDVDTRSDVYSLGVLLYELLTGTTPFEPERLHGAAYDEVCRLLREVEPPTPSSRITTLGEGAQKVAHHRNIEPAQLGKLVRGDLDWIVMKALEKDRARRYETASAFADDIRRHIEDQPVLAGPPSAAYRVHKFVRRNRAKVIAGLLVAASLVVGLGIASFAVAKAFQQNKRALAAHRERDAELERRQQAEQQAAEASQRVESERQARETETAALREEHRRTLLADAQGLVDQRSYAQALAKLKAAAGIRHDLATELLFWQVARDYQDQITEGSFQGCQFSPDGRYVAAGGWKAAIVTDLTTGESHKVGRHRSYVFGVAFSPNGTLAATAGQDNTAQVCVTATGEVVHELPHDSAVYGVAFGPDGAFLASTTEGKQAIVWGADTGERVATLELGQPGREVLFAGEGKWLCVLKWAGGLEVWDWREGKKLGEADGDGAGIGMDLRGGSLLLVSAHEPNKVRLWHLPELSQVHAFQADDPHIAGIALSPDGETLALGGSASIRLWDLAARKYVPPALASGARFVGFHPLTWALVSEGGQYTMELWDITEGRMLQKMANGPYGLSVGLNPQGTFLLASSIGRVEVCDTASGAVVQTFEGASGATFSPDGKSIACATSGQDAELSLRRIETGEVLWSARTLCSIDRLYFSPGGETLAVASKDGACRLLDATSGQLLHILAGHDPAEAPHAVFSPDGKLVATASGGVRLWSVQTGELVKTLDPNAGYAECFEFSPDGRFLACARPAFRLWDVATGDEPAWAVERRGQGGCIAFSPEGQTLALGTWKGAVLLFDLQRGEEVGKLNGHTDAVVQARFSPNGALLATGSKDGTSRLWDVRTGQEVARLERSLSNFVFTQDGHALGTLRPGAGTLVWDVGLGKAADRGPRIPYDGEQKYAVAVSPDGTTVATACQWGYVRFSKLDAQGEAVTVQGHALNRNVRSVAFSPNGKVLASGSGDGTVALWDVGAVTVVRTLKGHGGAVYSVAFSPDGQLLASGSQDGTIILWRADSGEKVRMLTGHQKPVNSVAFTPDGKMLVSGADDHLVKLWDVETGKELRTLNGHKDMVYGVAVSPDGRLLASGGNEWVVKIWDMGTGEELRSIRGGYKPAVNSLAFSPDGLYLAGSSAKETVEVWRADTCEEVHSFGGLDASVTGVAFTPDAKWLLATTGDDGALHCWDLESGAHRLLSGQGRRVSCAAFNPGGTLLATGSADRTVRLWDASTLEQRLLLMGHQGAVRAVVWSTDGRALVSAGDDKTLRVWDTASGGQQECLEQEASPVGCVALSPENKVLAAGNDAGAVRLWDAGSWHELNALEGHSKKVNALAWAPDGASLASAGSDNTVRLWDVRGSRQLHLLRLDAEGLSLAWRPDGSLVACGQSDGMIGLWDPAIGKRVGELSGHGKEVRWLAFRPDGKTLYSIGDDRALRVWDVDSRAQLLAMKPGKGRVSWTSDQWAALSPDGDRLALEEGLDVVIYNFNAYHQQIAAWLEQAVVR